MRPPPLGRRPAHYYDRIMDHLLGLPVGGGRTDGRVRRMGGISSYFRSSSLAPRGAELLTRHLVYNAVARSLAHSLGDLFTCLRECLRDWKGTRNERDEQASERGRLSSVIYNVPG